MLVLCVDDDQEDLTIFQEAMETIRKGTVFTIAQNGAEALDLLSTFRPDIIFLDINMPVMNGLETLQQIRLNPRFDRITVCMLSTFISNEQNRMYLRMGAACCLIKPNSFQDLCKILKVFFDERSEQTL